MLTEEQLNQKTYMAVCIEWMNKYNDMFPHEEKFDIEESIIELKTMNVDKIKEYIEIIKNSIVLNIEKEVVKNIKKNKNRLINLVR